MCRIELYNDADDDDENANIYPLKWNMQVDAGFSENARFLKWWISLSMLAKNILIALT